jgi:hypothetical protein
MSFKVVYQWSLGTSLWQEVYYNLQSSLDLAVSSATDPTLLAVMCGLRPPLAILLKVRVSDVENLRSSQLTVLNMPGTAASTAPDIITTSVVVQLNSSPAGWQRKVWMRGVPDSYTVRSGSSGADTPTAACLTSVNNIVTNLKIQSMAIRGLPKIGTAPNIVQGLSNITATANTGKVLLTNGGSVGPSAGDVIIISRMNRKLYPGLVGKFTVLSYTGGNIQVAWNSDVPLAIVPLVTGQWRPTGYVYNAINTVTSGFAYFGEHRTSGLPLGGHGARRGNRGLRLA